MNPAFSVVIFTTIAGAAQGLVVTLLLALLAGVGVSASFGGGALLMAEVMLLIGLGASFAHLGRPERAWRAVLMWRSSWLSREVIVLPLFIAAVGLLWLAWHQGHRGHVTRGLALAVLLLAGLLWFCTAMIYACLRFIQEWAQPLTLVNFVLIGLSSGSVLACALAAWRHESALLHAVAPFALGITLLALASRLLSLRRNAQLVPKSNLQSATGIKTTKLVQTSMGMSAGSFNTREFFHGRSVELLRHVRLGFVLLGFVLPALLMLSGLIAHLPAVWLLAVLLQAPGLMAERWFFFAQARHPQNLYYQTVS